MFKIAVYSIAKNEAAHVERWFESVRSADGIYVLDTGSEDNTLPLLENVCLEHPKVRLMATEFVPFRFDVARNFILNQIDNQYDYALFIDMDEVLEEGWYEKLQTFLSNSNEPDAVNLRLVYSTDANGMPLVTYNRLMVHRPKYYRWKYPVHEVLTPVGKGQLEVYSDILVYHLPDVKKKRSYSDLLRIGYEEFNDARSAYYYAQDLLHTGKYEYAYKIGVKAYNLEQSHLIRSEICVCIGNAFEAMEDYFSAKYWFIRGYSEAIEIRESWYAAAEFFFRHGKYYSALGCLDNILEISEIPTHSIIRYDNLYNETPHHLMALCYEQLGNEKNAEKYIQSAFAQCNTNRNVAEDLIRICKIPIKTV